MQVDTAYLRKQFTLPNLITLLRLLGIPLMAKWMLEERFPWPAFSLFALIWFTDVVDGFLARRFGWISDFGKVFDPFVDKLFQLVTALCLFAVHRLPLWVPVFILCKEGILFVVSLFLLRKRVVVHSNWLGKLTTVVYALAFATLFFLPPDQPWLSSLLFALPSLLSLLAALYYGWLYLGPTSEVKKR